MTQDMQCESDGGVCLGCRCVVGAGGDGVGGLGGGGVGIGVAEVVLLVCRSLCWYSFFSYA